MIGAAARYVCRLLLEPFFRSLVAFADRCVPMASSQEFLAPELFRCYHCGVESSDCSFKYFDNRKLDQPRYKCHHCQKLFTLGLHGRPQGKTYWKKRNVDPAELKGLSRQCRHCGVTDNATFKYYNNKNILQPCFKCLSCGKQFQMRLLGTKEERRLVATSSQQRTTPRRRKQGVPEPSPGNASSSSEDGSIYQPCNGSFMPLPSDSEIPLESAGASLLPEMSDDDAQSFSFLDSVLPEEETHEADFTSWIGNADNGSWTPVPSDPLMRPEMIGEDAVQYSDSLETEFAEPEENEEVNFTSRTGMGDPDSEPLALSGEDAEFLDFLAEAGLLAEESNEVYTESYADAAAACCRQMDLDMAAENSMHVENSMQTAPWTFDTSVVSNSVSYADAAAACCRQMDLDMAAKNSMQTAPSWTF